MINFDWNFCSLYKGGYIQLCEHKHGYSPTIHITFKAIKLSTLFMVWSLGNTQASLKINVHTQCELNYFTVIGNFDLVFFLTFIFNFISQILNQLCMKLQIYSSCEVNQQSSKIYISHYLICIIGMRLVLKVLFGWWWWEVDVVKTHLSKE